MNFLSNIKLWMSKIFLYLGNKLGAEKTNAPVIRNAKSIINKEIKIPSAISIIVTIIILYTMLVIGLGIDYKTMLAVAIFIAAVIIFFIFQTYSKEKDIFTDNDAVVLMCLLFIIGVLLLQISKEYLSPFIFPIAAFSLISGMLLSSRIGLLYGLVLSLFAALLNDMRFDIFLIMICSGSVIISDIKKIRRRSEFMTAGFKVALVNICTISMFYFLGQYTQKEYYNHIFHGILNGAFTTIIILVLMPALEKLFSRTTNTKLVELSDFNNPLLKRLMIEAPGTYHHSLAAATIAEQAADAIGANALLARVSAYYHDIGKLKNPEYFIENQSTSKNPHDPLTPAMSSLILVSHVKDGMALAKQYGLDNAIIDNIEQHHGTTLIYFFYHKSLEKNRNTDIENFRYPGPKPQTKVAAIVMVADSAEAACRALEEPTSVRIKETVEKIINNKFTDGQFSECPITLKDLQIIGDSITTSLIGIYHARIEYKDDEK